MPRYRRGMMPLLYFFMEYWMKLTIFDPADDYDSPPIHINKDNLAKYGSGDTFIETGTYFGETVDMVLKTSLYKNIHSIELNDELFNLAKIKYQNDPSVTIWHGDSVDRLREIVDSLEGPATFWLDAHASGSLCGGKTGGSPLLEELDIIASSPIKDHTIIIDDIRLFGSDEWSNIQKDDAVNKIMAINPKYNILYLDGHIKQDVLWATVKV